MRPQPSWGGHLDLDKELLSYRQTYGESVTTSPLARARFAVHVYAMSHVTWTPAGRSRSLALREPERLGIEMGLLDALFGRDTFELIQTICTEPNDSEGWPTANGEPQDERILAAATAIAELVQSGTSAADVMTCIRQAPPTIVIDALTHGIPLDYAVAMNGGAHS